MADMIGPLRVLSTWKAAENARHFRLLEVARDGLVVVVSVGVLNRAGEAVDLGPDHVWHTGLRGLIQLEPYVAAATGPTFMLFTRRS